MSQDEKRQPDVDPDILADAQTPQRSTTISTTPPMSRGCQVFWA